MNNNDGRVVTLTNISAEDFTHAYAGVPYSVKAGESITLPYYLGAHLATHLARRILVTGEKAQNNTNSDNAPAWSDTEETALVTQILGNVLSPEIARPKTEAELLAEQVAELNAWKKDVENGVVPVPVNGARIVDPDGSDAQNVQEGIDFRSKADVVEELKKRNIPFDARKPKAELEALLITE